MTGKKALHSEECTKDMIALLDTLDILNGKWKIAIMCSLNERKKDLRNCSVM